MKYSNNSGNVSPGASSHAERRSDCKCTSSTNYYDCSGSLDAYDPATTCTACEQAFVRDIVNQFGSIEDMEEECKYIVDVYNDAHFYLTRKYSIHYHYVDPVRRAQIDADIAAMDDLPF